MKGKVQSPLHSRVTWVCTIMVAVLWVAVRTVVAAEELPKLHGPISISARWMQSWSEGDEDVAIFRGHCVIQQGSDSFEADKMVVWKRSRELSPGVITHHFAVWMEENVVARVGNQRRDEAALFITLSTTEALSLEAAARESAVSGEDDPLYRRALERRLKSPGRVPRALVQKTQYTVPAGPALPPPLMPPAPPDPNSFSGIRRIRLFPRSALPYDIQSFRNDQTLPPEQVVQITGGISIIVDGVPTVGTIDLSADRAVIFTTALENGEWSADSTQSREMPFQVYLEGNIVIRQGESEIRAARAFYDAKEDRALVLDADMRARMPQDGITVRIRAESIRQAAQSVHARNAWLTTSELGDPTYRIQSSDIFVEQRPWSPFSEPQIDPETGQPKTELHPWVSTYNNAFLLGDVPLFYTPYLSAPAESPNMPLQGLTFKQDHVMGFQVRTQWDAFTLFGLQRPEGMNLTLDLNYLSERGPYVGTSGDYASVDPYGNPFSGKILGSYVYDSGKDNLGLGRRSLDVPNDNRGLLQLQHKHELPDGWLIQGELGYASDRNYREQYYERAFDTDKDLETYLYALRKVDNEAYSIFTSAQINPYENDTQWLPRGDYFLLGHSLLNNRLSYSTHSSVGYATLNPANAPTDPNDVFSPLPYYTSANGLVSMSRHELEMPLNFGPLNVVPYAMGEAAFWSDSFNNDSIGRLYGRGGVRASIQFWKVYPYIQSEIFNLNGLAHRMILDADYGYAQSSRSLSEIPQWNQLDDNSQERFRERFLTNEFGGVLPGQFDPRFYAVRSVAATGVADPYNELVDDQQVLQLAWRHRLQTKVGPPERLRVKDWMTLDLGVNYYPEKNRDNFGEDFGLFSARYAWYVGDRTSIHASSLMDFFSDAQNLYSVGVLTQRGHRGSLYLGYRQIQGGPIDSKIITASYSYQMSPKWISTVGTAYDIGEHRNRGQSLTITRVGESFLFHLGASYDASKNNPGIAFSIEPRLGNKNTSPTMISPLLGSGF